MILTKTYFTASSGRSLVGKRVQMVPELSEDEAILLLDAYKGLSHEPNEDVRQVHVSLNSGLFLYAEEIYSRLLVCSIGSRNLQPNEPSSCSIFHAPSECLIDSYALSSPVTCFWGGINCIPAMRLQLSCRSKNYWSTQILHITTCHIRPIRSRYFS